MDIDKDRDKDKNKDRNKEDNGCASEHLRKLPCELDRHGLAIVSAEGKDHGASEGSEGNGEKEKKEWKEGKGPKSKGAVLFLSLLVCAMALLLWGFSLADAQVKEEAEAVSELGTEELWRGAFESRESCERCLSFSVSVRLGELGEYAAPSATGVVVSGDGWIATSADIVQNAQLGRLYVGFWDGREYAVERLRRDREHGIVFLKIDAGSLELEVPCRRSSETLCMGERVVSLSSSGAPEHKQTLLHGAITAIGRSAAFGGGAGQTERERLISTDLSFEGSAVGSPVFDCDGELVGISLYEGTGLLLPAEELFKIYN